MAYGFRSVGARIGDCSYCRITAHTHTHTNLGEANITETVLKSVNKKRRCAAV
jgi:hypothetical protein